MEKGRYIRISKEHKMAAMVSEVNGAENDLNNAKHPSLVILDSDEEEEQTTSELFQGFIKAVQPFLERKEILLLRVKFAEIRPEYASSTTFRELLRRKASQVHKTDVYIHFNEILQTLISNAALYGRNALKPNREDEVKSIGGSTSDANTEETTMAGKFETDRQGAYRVTSKPGTSAQSDQSIQIEIQIVDLDDQSSSLNSQKHPVRHMSKDDQEENIRKQNRKKKIMKLERKLKHISSEIKRLTQSELSLEEMELADSNYMKESRLKEQFNKVWEKICLLKGRPPDTGRVVEQEVKVKGTNFPAIDKAVRKFLKKKKGFPNIFDVRNIVIKANKKCGLGLTPSVVQEIAADVFTDIGNKIQKKRKKDYEYNFGCHLTDDCLSSLDPALNDYDLRKKLDENKKVSQSKLEDIFQKYVHLGRIKGQENYDSTPCNSDYESSDDETHVRKKAKKRKTDSSDSSGSDPERKVKRAKHRQQQAATTSNSEVNVPEVKPTSRNRNLEKASCSGFSQSTLTTSKYESIEIIDDDDDDDDNITAVSNQKYISENTKTACSDKPLNQTSSTSNTNESSKNLETSSLNHIGEPKSLSNGISESLPAPTKPKNDINESVHHENISNDPGKPLNHSNLSNGLNEIVNDDQIVDSEVSATDNNKYVINRITKHKEQPHDTQISEDSLVEMSDSSVVCLDTSLKSNNSIPSNKPQLNTSKLHLKISQLRDKKLSDLNTCTISDVNPKSEVQTSLTNSVMSESRCHKRKSTAPHHIHVNGCTPSTSNDSPAMQHWKNTKYPKISDSPGVTKPSSTPVTMIQNCNAGLEQHFDSVKELPLKEQNSCTKTQDTRRTAKCSLIESPAQSVTTKMLSYRSPLNSVQSIQSDSNKYSSTNATSNSILSGNSPQLKKSLRNDTASSKTSPIIILSDDED